MSMFKTFAIAAASAAILVGAPAGVAQGPQDRDLLGGPGAAERSYAGQGYGDRDYRGGPGGGQGVGQGGGQFGDPRWGGGGFNTRSLEGLRVNSAKDALRRAGFSYSRAIRENGRQYDLWWSGRSCVGFTSYNGRVTDARGFRDVECGYLNVGRDGRINARDLEGVRVDVAKDALRRAGFDYARAIRVGGRQYDLWSGRGRRDTCVGFTSYNGRVTDARQFGGREC